MKFEGPPSPIDPNDPRLLGGWRAGETHIISSSGQRNALDVFEKETSEDINVPAYIRKALRTLHNQKPQNNPNHS